MLCGISLNDYDTVWFCEKLVYYEGYNYELFNSDVLAYDDGYG